MRKAPEGNAEVTCLDIQRKLSAAPMGSSRAASKPRDFACSSFCGAAPWGGGEGEGARGASFSLPRKHVAAVLLAKHPQTSSRTLWPSGQGVGLLSRWGLPAWVRIPQVSFGLPFVVRGTHVCSDSPLLLQGHSPNAPVVVCCRTAARCVPGGRTLLAFGAARSWKHFKTLWPSG